MRRTNCDCWFLEKGEWDVPEKRIVQRGWRMCPSVHIFVMEQPNIAVEQRSSFIPMLLSKQRKKKRAIFIVTCVKTRDGRVEGICFKIKSSCAKIAKGAGRWECPKIHNGEWEVKFFNF